MIFLWFIVYLFFRFVFHFVSSDVRFYFSFLSSFSLSLSSLFLFFPLRTSCLVFVFKNETNIDKTVLKIHAECDWDLSAFYWMKTNRIFISIYECSLLSLDWKCDKQFKWMQKGMCIFYWVFATTYFMISRRVGLTKKKKFHF